MGSPTKLTPNLGIRGPSDLFSHDKDIFVILKFDVLFQTILEKTIRIPRSLSVRAAQILKQFLNKVVPSLLCHFAISRILLYVLVASPTWKRVSTA